jgi:hypothetical protein
MIKRTINRSKNAKSFGFLGRFLQRRGKDMDKREVVV